MNELLEPMELESIKTFLTALESFDNDLYYSFMKKFNQFTK